MSVLVNACFILFLLEQYLNLLLLCVKWSFVQPHRQSHITIALKCMLSLLLDSLCFLYNTNNQTVELKSTHNEN